MADAASSASDDADMDWPADLAPPKKAQSAATWKAWYAKVRPKATAALVPGLRDSLPEAGCSRKDLIDELDDAASALRSALRTLALVAASAPAPAPPPAPHAPGAVAPVVHVSIDAAALQGAGLVPPVGAAGAGAGGGGGSSSTAPNPPTTPAVTAASLGLDQSSFAAHPHNFTADRADELLDAVCGPSRAELDQIAVSRRVHEEAAAKARSGSAGRASAEAPAAPAPKYDLLSRDMGLAQAFAACSLSSNTPVSFISTLGGLIAVATALAEDDRDTSITIPLSRLFRATPGTTPAWRVVAEHLVITFETRGRARLNAIVVEYQRKNPDPAQIAYKSPDGRIIATDWPTRMIRLYLQSHKTWLERRTPAWKPPTIAECIIGPHPPLPLINRVVNSLSLIKPLVLLGLLDVVDLADRSGEVLGESLVAWITSFEHFMTQWRDTFVDTKANRDALTKSESAAAGAKTDPRSTGDSSNPATSDRRRKPRNPKQRAGANANASAAAGAGAGAGGGGGGGGGAGAGASGTNHNPRPSTGSGPQAPGAPKRTRDGDGDGNGNHPKATDGRPTYNKCYWIGADGSECKSVPPYPVREPLCRNHRNRLDGMSIADRKAHIDRINAAGHVTLS